MCSSENSSPTTFSSPSFCAARPSRIEPSVDMAGTLPAMTSSAHALYVSAPTPLAPFALTFSSEVDPSAEQTSLPLRSSMPLMLLSFFTRTCWPVSM